MREEEIEMTELNRQQNETNGQQQHSCNYEAQRQTEMQKREEKRHKRKMFWLKHTNSLSVLIMILAFVPLYFLYTLYSFALRMNEYIDLYGKDTFSWSSYFSDIRGGFLTGLIIMILFVYPFLLTVLNAAYLVAYPKSKEGRRSCIITGFITWILGGFYSCMYIAVSDIRFEDWTETLTNSEIHTPISTAGMPTIVVIGVLAFIGYLILSWIPSRNLPPMITVISMSVLYLGIIVTIITMIQLCKFDGLFIDLFLLNCVIMSFRVIRKVVTDWNEFHKEKDQQSFQRSRKFLEKSASISLIAFILILPLLGVIVCILALFGQRPDSIITAFTQTADWNLSMRIAPQNIIVDEHYLCTVAAGGHKKIVKPLRLGMRHGHQVIVNRQLCVANAFEQILEEKTPKFHRAIRHFYDTYGYPIARKIHSQWTADFVYFIMKPLEWFFLIVLYSVDRNPENRIAVQYFPMTPDQKEYYQKCSE